ncbi:hypothetical protein [Litchfieldia salsa]|uniref:Uncharacterized protein n=1 Tax=Litchfieldia salsa TaxID=930152 RepID=A0A1H0X3B8_9BACI|nr:hypothetical protein [Litchfieldia salsa]SDP97412.1 hypothetical protein SAMN05216565_1291 [Litchfieldia salsa]
MNNYASNNHPRRFRAHVSFLGTTQLYSRNPYVVAWWSAAFSGLGHFMLSKYLSGALLFTWEVLINYQAKINLAMVYTFCGKIELAKETLDTRWMLMYIPVYLFAIWDSYRTAVSMNNVSVLASREDTLFNTFSINPFELNFIEKRVPIMAVLWSVFTPGLGQLYLHQILSGFFFLVWTIIFFYFSHSLEAIQMLFVGNIEGAKSVLDKQWFLFIYSLYGFVIIDSYANTVENNKLFDHEQSRYLVEHYQSREFKVLKGKVVH